MIGKPPNYEAIVAAIGRPPETAVYAWGGTIYVPYEPLPHELYAHELVHFRQQEELGGPEAWWERYLADPAFRLEQEIEAYRAQIASHPNRAARRACLRDVAADLAGPMYGRILSKDRALQLLAA